jgi:hypothetical protein
VSDDAKRIFKPVGSTQRLEHAALRAEVADHFTFETGGTKGSVPEMRRSPDKRFGPVGVANRAIRGGRSDAN